MTVTTPKKQYNCLIEKKYYIHIIENLKPEELSYLSYRV